MLATTAAIALCVRLVYLAQVSGSPLFSVTLGDARQYDAWAQRIAGGDWLGSGVFYQSPLYPYFLAVVFTIGGHSLMAVRVLQSLLGAASCALLAVATRRFVGSDPGPRAGLAAGLLLALYPPAIFFDGLIQKAALDLFLVALLLALLGEFQHRPARRWLVAAGVAYAALMLNRENARLLYPVIVLWLIAAFRGTALRRRLAWAAAFSAAATLVLLPVGLRNYHAGGEFLLSTSQLGPNLYIGNHAGAHGSYEPLVPERGDPAYERDDATQLAQRAVGRPLSAGAVSDYWVRRTLEDVRADPRAWLLLMGRKLLLTLNAHEAVDTESIEVYARYSSLLRALSWLDFGVILPLAALGLWFTRREWRRLVLLYAGGAMLILSVAIFYVVARYRYPLVPFVLVFAGAAVARVVTAGVRRAHSVGALPAAWRQWAPAVALALVAATVAHLPLKASEDETDVNLGAELTRIGRPADAVVVLERAVAAAPNYAPSHFHLGVALDRTGDTSKAIDEWLTAVRLQPDYASAHTALAVALGAAGRPEEALDHFATAVHLRPDAAEARLNFGLALIAAGDRQQGMTHLREAVRLAPANATAQNTLAGALHAEGDLAGAVEHYREALRVRPDYAEAHSNFAMALEQQGDHEGALQHLRDAVRLQPEDRAMRLNLANLLSEGGRTDEAIEHYERAVALSGGVDEQYSLAQAYGRVGRLNDAITVLERALAAAQAEGREQSAQQIAGALAMCRAQQAATNRAASARRRTP